MDILNNLKKNLRSTGPADYGRTQLAYRGVFGIEKGGLRGETGSLLKSICLKRRRYDGPTPKKLKETLGRHNKNRFTA